MDELGIQVTGSSAREMPPLVLMTGAAAQNLSRIDRLVAMGSVVLIAANADVARAWLATDKTNLDDATISFDRLHINLLKHRAMWEEEELDVTARELHILAALAEEPGRAWSFIGLEAKVWGTMHYGDGCRVRSAVKRLRRKLADAGVGLSIESVRGVGFRLGPPKLSERLGTHPV
jgi:two-component system, OmpR family, response regulator MtrA